MKTICIHQPDFLPYLGFFHRLLFVDHFILLDDVQFIRRGWQHRDQIKSRNGLVWLTLSVQKGDFHQAVNQVTLSIDEKWIENNLNLIKDCYGKARYFDEIFPIVESIYRAGHSRMIDLNYDFLTLALKYFDIDISMSYASQYAVKLKGTERLVSLVQETEGQVYLTGTGSKNYLEEDVFAKAGLTVTWQQFMHPEYYQLYGKFEAMLSCLDILFNCGPNSASVLRSTSVYQ